MNLKLVDMSVFLTHLWFKRRTAMKSKNSLKNILNRYRHAWVFLYGFIYMPWFLYLEKRTIPAHEYFIINSPLDKYIPFCEYFVMARSTVCFLVLCAAAVALFDASSTPWR